MSSRTAATRSPRSRTSPPSPRAVEPWTRSHRERAHDVAAAIVNNNFARQRGLPRTTAIFRDDPSDERRAVREHLRAQAEDADNERPPQLVELYQSTRRCWTACRRSTAARPSSRRCRRPSCRPRCRGRGRAPGAGLTQPARAPANRRGPRRRVPHHRTDRDQPEPPCRSTASTTSARRSSADRTARRSRAVDDVTSRRRQGRGVRRHRPLRRRQVHARAADQRAGAPRPARCIVDGPRSPRCPDGTARRCGRTSA